ncbi:hypothetical protein EVAR_98190_1 [Eumeta japonica]|uniref:Uncharacterized protein n=1 Tax=Eumeta variegata TaxID=151549 RepID=A0A4C2A1M3_EUMVA|nr:hypothetical protein EVAR_98190_1 [Eumeta japonica]
MPNTHCREPAEGNGSKNVCETSSFASPESELSTNFRILDYPKGKQANHSRRSFGSRVINAPSAAGGAVGQLYLSPRPSDLARTVQPCAARVAG